MKWICKKCRRLLIVLVGILLWSWILLYNAHLMDAIIRPQESDNGQKIEKSSKYTDVSQESGNVGMPAVHINLQGLVVLDQRHAARRQTMMEACKGRELDPVFRGNRTERDIKGYFLVDRKHSVVYCAMEKVGTTFWMRLWQIMAGLCSDKSPYDMSPGSSVGGGPSTFKNLSFDEIHTILSTYRSFIITRHPFVRLFSGYVDKLFSPNPIYWKAIGRYIVANMREGGKKQKKPCGNDVTFPEMVKYLIHSETHNLYRDGHFLPMYDHCRPCQIKYDIIGKMESFVDDTLYILKSLGFQDLYNNLNKTMRGASVIDTISEQTNTLFRNKHETCTSFYDSQRTIWRTFQIRGIISKNSKYPFMQNEAENITKQVFIKAVKTAVGDASIPAIAKQYRNEAYAQAYSSVSREDLKKLVQVLRPDCEIFGYDCSLESLDAEMKKYRSEMDYFDIASA